MYDVLAAPERNGVLTPYRQERRRPTLWTRTSAPVSRAPPPQQRSWVTVGAPIGRPDRFFIGRSTSESLEPGGMPNVEVSRTLVKSAPELWAELESERLGEAVGAARVETTEPERELSWRAPHVCGTA